MKIISWNLAHSDEPWRVLTATNADIALVQEAGAPPAGLDLLLIDLAPRDFSGSEGT